MKYINKINPTSNIEWVKLLDSSSTTGAGKQSLAYNTPGLVIGVRKAGEATSTVYTSAAGTIEDITTSGTYEAPTAGKCRFKEMDSTAHPGVYEFMFADERYANTTKMLCSVSGATNLAEADFEIQMSPVDSQVKGMDANTLNNAAIADSAIAVAKIAADLKTGNNINAEAKVAAAPADMALQSALNQVEENILLNIDYLSANVTTVDTKVTDSKAEVRAILRGGLVTTGTARSGSSLTIQLAVDAPGTNLINNVVVLTGGTGVGQARLIASYDTDTKIATVEDVAAFSIAPDETTTYDVFSGAYQIGLAKESTFATLVSDLREAIWNALIEYVDEAGVTRKTKAYVMLQAMFSTIKQRLKIKP